MMQRLGKALGVLIVALLATFALALPARAWTGDVSFSNGYELSAQDTSLFEGYELWSKDVEFDWDFYDSTWRASDLIGSRGYCVQHDLYLAVEGSEGEQRIDLTDPQYATLANAQVILKAQAGTTPDIDLDNMEPIKYDSRNLMSFKPEYSLESYEIHYDDETTETLYYYVFEGNLSDIMGIYSFLRSYPADVPYPVYVPETWEEVDFYGIEQNIGAHVGFADVQEVLDGVSTPQEYTTVSGDYMFRFFGAKGFKFTLAVDEGYILDEVTYTANGATYTLEPTDETAMSPIDWDFHPVYQVPPTEAMVTINASAHKVGYTVNPDGTITFEGGYLPDANKVTFSLSGNITFDRAMTDTEIWGPSFREAFAVPNDSATHTGGNDYYCWADVGSFFKFSIPAGYVLTGASISPVSAGEIMSVNNSGQVCLRLSAPATLSLAVEKINWDQVDSDPKTNISVALSNCDVRKIKDCTLYVNQVTDATAIENAKDTIVGSLADDDTFFPNEMLIYDVWYLDSEGNQVIGGLIPYGALEFPVYITIPLPVGWDANAVRVYQYYEELANKGVARRDVTPIYQGAALRVSVDYGLLMLGRFVVTCESSMGPHEAGWSYETDGTYYYDDFGQRMTNYWHVEGSTYYYFGKDGKLVTNNWVQASGKWYYMDENGKLVWTGVSYYQGKYYWVQSGSVLTKANGWKTYNGAYYCFNGAYGAAYQKQWFKYGNAYYYFGADGRLVVNGWVIYNGNYFYMGSNGQPLVNTSIVLDGVRYTFNASGICTGATPL